MTGRLQIDIAEFRYDDALCLERLRFSVEPGTFLGLVGPNGSGKTTLLKLIAGLLVPTRGKVLLDGRPIDETSAGQRARQVAYVAQRATVQFPFSVVDLVLLGRVGQSSGLWWHSADDLQLARRTLERVGLQEYAERYVDTLSGGEFQRMMIARALIQETDILLLDEPTSALDLQHQVEVCELLRTEHRRGKTVVAVLHDLNLAALYCDELLLLHDRTVAAAGTPADVLTREILEPVYGSTILVGERDDRELPYVLPRPT